MEIKGKNALITGSAAGIGQATAFALADAGAAGIPEAVGTAGASLGAVDGFGTNRLVISGSSVQPPANKSIVATIKIGATGDVEHDVSRRGFMVGSLSESGSEANRSELTR